MFRKIIKRMIILRGIRVLRRTKLLLFIMAPILLLVTCVSLFFIVDDFWLYMQLFVLNNDEKVSEGYNSGDYYYSGGNDGSGNNSGSRVEFSGQGSDGINLMLINKLTGGYIKDYLEIVRDHCNWKYVNENIKRHTSYIPINTMIGMSQLETSGIEVEYNGKKLVMPQTNLNYDEYNSVDGLNLYTANSEWFKKNGLKYINRNTRVASTMQFGGSDTDGGGTAHTTPYQFDMIWFAEVPDGNASYGSCSNWPSLLNTGYGYTEGVIRDKTQTDAAYFPDVLSVLIQSAYRRMFDGADVDMLENPEMAANMMHIGHHGQGSVWDVATGYNSDENGFADNSPMDRTQSFSSMLNIYSEYMQKVFDYFAEHVDSGLDWKWNGRENYLGLGVGMFFQSGNAFFKNESDRDKLINDFSNNIDFYNGVMLGFEIASGRKYTEQEVKDILNSSSSLRTNLTQQGYPSGGMRYGTGSKVYKYSLYLMDDSTNVIYKNTDGSTVSAIHGWNAITLRMAFLGPLYGTYQMWEMLKAAGVDCTYAEVMSYNKGELVDIIPNYSGKNIGYIIAECATLMTWEDGNYDGRDWTSKEIAYNTWGNSIYIKVHQEVNKYNSQYRCCDAFVNTAILWSGADSTCIGQGVTYKVIPYLQDSNKWEEVCTWEPGERNPDISKVAPGDIIITSGHVMLYVGEVVADIYPQYSDSISTHNLVHASYSHSYLEGISGNGNSARSGKFGGLAENITGGGFSGTIRAFRCINPDRTDGPVALTPTEITYLKEHPFQTKEQYHYTANSSGARYATDIQINTR